jgi:hypothetical protein
MNSALRAFEHLRRQAIERFAHLCLQRCFCSISASEDDSNTLFLLVFVNATFWEGTRDTPATPDQSAVAESVGGEGHRRSPARYPWAMLIARIYEVFPLVCQHCGTEMRIIAFVTDTASVTRILEHIGELPKAPVLSPARGPPTWEPFDQTPGFDPVAPAPAPAFEFD